MRACGCLGRVVYTCCEGLRVGACGCASRLARRNVCVYVECRTCGMYCVCVLVAVCLALRACV